MSLCSTLQILGLMVVRKMLDFVFSQHDLAWIDDLLPSTDSDLDRRYCVVKLHIPYKDLVHPDVEPSQWGAYCEAADTHSTL